MQRTRRADELVLPVEEWLASTNALLHPPSFAPAKVERCFRIASTDYGVLTVIAPALAEITGEAPAVTFDIVSFSPDMMQKLASGEIDLIVSGLPPEQDTISSRTLFSDTFRCIMREGHALAGPDTPLALDEYFAWPHIGVVVNDLPFDGVDERLGKRNGERRVTARLPYFHAAPALLAGSNALMTLPSRAATRFADSYGLAIRPAPEMIAPLDYRLLWHPRSARDLAIQWLADLLARCCHAPE
jgi:DNA-binding transcriptional LysR family regulator